MLILALESTARTASAALAEEDECLCVTSSDCGLTHSEQLLPMVEHLLAVTGKKVTQIDAFACTVGPGSFTGVRIAAAVLKGLAFGSGKPCVPVSTLESLARNLLPGEGYVCPVMDARRDQVYTALYRAEGDCLRRLWEDEALSLGQLSDRLRGLDAPVALVGDGYDVARAALSEAGIPLTPTPLLLRAQNAFSTALCARELLRAGQFVSDEALRPTYLRVPQAERERLEREKGIL